VKVGQVTLSFDGWVSELGGTGISVTACGMCRGWESGNLTCMHTNPSRTPPTEPRRHTSTHTIAQKPLFIHHATVTHLLPLPRATPGFRDFRCSPHVVPPVKSARPSLGPRCPCLRAIAPSSALDYEACSAGRLSLPHSTSRAHTRRTYGSIAAVHVRGLSWLPWLCPRFNL
jgi:hypothetical protein